MIFCSKYQDCTDLYLSLRQKLGTNFTNPPGYPVTQQQFRIVDMYTRAAMVEMKKMLNSFKVNNGNWSTVIATTAFTLAMRDGRNISETKKLSKFGTPISKFLHCPKLDLEVKANKQRSS